MRVVLFIIGVLVISISSVCQQPSKYGKVSQEEFQKKYDSSAHAVVLFDVGSTEIKGNEKGWFSLEYKRHRRIHIIDKNGYDQASFAIPLYTDGELEEQLEDLKATAYNNEGGKVVETKLDKASVFKEKRNPNLVIKKFTLPNVKEGTIIEYEYKVTSDFLFNLQPWNFQGSLPVLWSEYKVALPQFLNYILISQGSEPFAVRDQVSKRGDFSLDRKVETGGYGSKQTERISISCGVTTFRWAMKDVPALKEEAYITTLDNYNARIEFQLAGFQEPLTPTKVMTTWPELSADLQKKSDFGMQLEPENTEWMIESLQPIITGANNYLDKAKKIHTYLRDNFTCTSYDRVFTEQSLKDVFKKKSGNVAEINLLLTALLRRAGVFTNPVILSTRDNGYIYSKYPVIGRFNHVIAVATIDDKEILLDASRPLAFGKLDADCYNGEARVVNEQAAQLMLSPDLLVEKKSVAASIHADNAGHLIASVSEELGDQQSGYYRRLMSGKGKEAVNQSVKESLGPDVSFSGFETINAAIEEPLTLKYTVNFNNEKSDIIYLNPFVSTGKFSKNPFKSDDRKYPVEMPYKIADSYILSLIVPAEYKVDELPKPMLLKLNAEQDMVYEYNISQTGNEIKLICRFQTTRTKFEPGEYNGLRAFFDRVVAKQNEQIVLKKK